MCVFNLFTEILTEYQVSVQSDYTLEGNVGVARCVVQGGGARVQVVNWLRQEPGAERRILTQGHKYLLTSNGALHVNSLNRADSDAAFYCQTLQPTTGKKRLSSPGKLSITGKEQFLWVIFPFSLVVFCEHRLFTNPAIVIYSYL